MAIRIIVSEVFSVVNVFLFYCRLPSNIYCIKIVLLFLQAHMYIKLSEHLLIMFTLRIISQQYLI